MNRALIFSAFLSLSLTLQTSAEERPVVYPFDVKVADQEAVISGKHAIFAKIPQPVSNDAQVLLDADPEMVIINVFRCNEKGEVTTADSAKAKIIMAQNDNKVQLNQTMDSTTLEDGLYLMNIVLRSKGTSRVMFRVGEGEALATDKKMPEDQTNATGAIDQSSPDKVVTAIFDAARNGDFTPLKTLLPPSGKHDGDVERVCGAADADAETKASFTSFFKTGKVSAPARISGDKAQVDFLFGPDGTKKETMNLILEEGKWYLGSF